MRKFIVRIMVAATAIAFGSTVTDRLTTKKIEQPKTRVILVEIR